MELPLSLPGLRAGLTFVFLMASTTYVRPACAGRERWVTGMLVWQDVLENLDAQLASAEALVMTLIPVAAAAIYRACDVARCGLVLARPASAVSLPRWLCRTMDVVVPPLNILLAVGLGLLLLPLGLVLVQSFNDVPQATMAGFRGFTLRLYQQLFSSGLYLDSLRIFPAELAVTTALLHRRCSRLRRPSPGRDDA